MIRRDYNHPADLLVGAVQRDVGPLHERAEARQGEARPRLHARDAAVGGLRLPPREVARPDAARRGQLGLLRPRPHGDRPQLVARVPAGLGLGRGRCDKVERRHRARLDVELRAPATSRTPADDQQRVRQRVGLRRARTGDVDWSWDYHRAVNAFRRHPKRRGLALHRAPRRHQRVERLLALRPLARRRRGIERARRTG